jgi:hypothetical protein
MDDQRKIDWLLARVEELTARETLLVSQLLSVRVERAQLRSSLLDAMQRLADKEPTLKGGTDAEQ